MWLGGRIPHRVRCANGHVGSPRPNDVLQGQGICAACVGKAWDVFYVVVDEEADVLKFGITTGDPRPRLKDHRAEGFSEVERLFPGLPEGVALELERNVLAALRDAGESPVRGREFFPARALPLVLDLVDHHPATRLASDA